MPVLRTQSVFSGRKSPPFGYKILHAALRAEVLARPVDMKSQRRQIVREELLRSIAWVGLGIVGWPIVIAEVGWLDTTALTVLGLPVLTWAALTTGAIGVRTATSKALQTRTPAGLTMGLLLGTMLGGIGAVYLVTTGGYPVLWVSAAYVVVTSIGVLWYWFVRPPAVASEATA